MYFAIFKVSSTIISSHPLFNGWLVLSKLIGAQLNWKQINFSKNNSNIKGVFKKVLFVEMQNIENIYDDWQFL